METRDKQRRRWLTEHVADVITSLSNGWAKERDTLRAEIERQKALVLKQTLLGSEFVQERDTLAQQVTTLREALAAALARLETELDTPQDMWADHIRVAVDTLRAALAATEGGTT